MSTKKPAKAKPGKKINPGRAGSLGSAAAKANSQSAARKRAAAKVTPRKSQTAEKSRPVTRNGKPLGRRKLDLEAMERDYRTGRFTDQELADKHGVARETVGRNAKRLGWKKDLKDAIAQATRVAVAEAASQDALASVTQTIAENAELNKQVILGHRSDIRTIRNEAFVLLRELQVAPENADSVEDVLRRLGDLERDAAMADEDMAPKEREKRLARIADEKAAIRKQVREMADIHNRVGSMQKLTDMLVKLQGLERKAFDLDRGGGGDGDYEKLLDSILV